MCIAVGLNTVDERRRALCKPLIRSGCHRWTHENWRKENIKVCVCVRLVLLCFFFFLSWIHGCKAFSIVRRHRWLQQKQKKKHRKVLIFSWVRWERLKVNRRCDSVIFISVATRELSQGARTIKNLYIVCGPSTVLCTQGKFIHQFVDEST